VAHTAVSIILQKVLLVPMIGLWLLHLSQRRYKEAGTHKRIATLSLTAVLIGAWLAAYIFAQYRVDDIYLIAVAAAAVAIPIALRKIMLPYKLHCVSCGASLPLGRVVSIDSNLCGACEPRVTKEETP
jgi:hypothetical protein